MFLSTILLLSSTALALPSALAPRATPKVYLCGDSTTAVNGGGSGTQGWGAYLQYSLSLTVVNNAKAGTSARSFTDTGRFAAVAASVVSGDYVIMEFGHNDGGSLSPVDNGRSDCFGGGAETCTTDAGIVVQTYYTYLVNAAKLMTAKGAKVIFSSPTPNNPWEGGTFAYSTPRFTTYAKSAATTIGSSAAFVDHGQYVANIFKTLGAKTVDSYFPNDHTHTSPAGADTVNKAFVKGLLCGGSPLAGYIKNSTASVQGACI